MVWGDPINVLSIHCDSSYSDQNKVPNFKKGGHIRNDAITCFNLIKLILQRFCRKFHDFMF